MTLWSINRGVFVTCIGTIGALALWVGGLAVGSNTTVVIAALQEGVPTYSSAKNVNQEPGGDVSDEVLTPTGTITLTATITPTLVPTVPPMQGPELWILTDKKLEVSVAYEAVLTLDSQEGQANVQNEVTVRLSGDETELDKAMTVIRIDIPTPTPTSTSTPTETSTPTPTATVTPTASATPTRQTGISSADNPIPTILLIAILFIIAMGALVYVGAIAKFCADFDEAKGSTDLAEKLCPQRISLVREGIYLNFIISALLVLAVDRGVPADGAISLLSAVAGYVFGRVSAGRNF